MTQQQRSSGTKLVPPPRDFVPQGELALRYQDKNKIQQSLLENNNEEEDSTQTGMSQHRQGSGGAQQSSASQNPLYKTELCRSWEEFGTCRYGTKCQFAHSLEELRPVQRHPKYKTEVCRTFATTGTCPYGTRCRFIHQSTALAQLRTAKATPSMPQEPQVMLDSKPQMIPGGGLDNNPASFANVARGASKKMAQRAHPVGSAASSQLSGSSNSLMGGPDYATVASRGGASFPQESPPSLVQHNEYETALTAALDVLHCNDDEGPFQLGNQQLMGSTDALQPSFSGDSISGHGSLPTGILPRSTSLVSGSPNEAGSMPTSPHTHPQQASAQGARRLPVFSNLVEK
ncbi:hypothetical protein M9435_004210 [Picochlorum sp. BPE23]|nr:hypothetical protein M9435_004210 [Picochlorum sp. BPE23]